MTCQLLGDWDVLNAQACDCPSCAEKLAAWRDAHWRELEEERLRCIRWRAPDVRVAPGVRRAVKQMLLARTGHRCALCGDRISLDRPCNDPLLATLDHIKPLARGGEDCLANWQIACLSCNQKKGDKWSGTG